MKYFKALALACLFALTTSASAAPLSLVQWIEDGLNGVDNMDCSNDSITSPDEKFVYTASFCDYAINVFERDSATGQLNLVDSMVQDQTTLEGFAPTGDILMSPDGSHLYMYGTTYVDGYIHEGIAMFERNAETGLLTQSQFYEGRGISYAPTLVMSDDGNYIYFGSINGRAMLVLKRAANGILSEAQYIDNVVDTITNDVIVEMELSPDQNHLYVGMDFTENVIAWFQRDQATGLLTYAGEISTLDAATASLGEPYNFIISHDGNSLYMTNSVAESDVEIWHFKINDDASLSLTERISELPEGHPKGQFFYPEKYAISSNDRLLYFIDIDSLQLWQRDITTGTLTYLGAEQENKDAVPDRGLSQVSALRLNRDGRFAHVAADDGLAIFDISADTSVIITSPAADAATFDVNVNIQNLGPATAHGLTANINLPAGVSLVSASPAGSSTSCEAAEQVVTCTVGTVPDAASEAITLSLQAPQAGGSAGLTAQLSQYEVDPNPANNTDVGLSEPGSTPPGNSAPPATPPTPTTPAPADPSGSDGGSSGGGGGNIGFLSLLLLLGLWGGQLVTRHPSINAYRISRLR